MVWCSRICRASFLVLWFFDTTLRLWISSLRLLCVLYGEKSGLAYQGVRGIVNDVDTVEAVATDMGACNTVSSNPKIVPRPQQLFAGSRLAMQHE